MSISCEQPSEHRHRCVRVPHADWCRNFSRAVGEFQAPADCRQANLVPLAATLPGVQVALVEQVAQVEQAVLVALQPPELEDFHSD